MMSKVLFHQCMCQVNRLLLLLAGRRAGLYAELATDEHEPLLIPRLLAQGDAAKPLARFEHLHPACFLASNLDGRAFRRPSIFLITLITLVVHLFGLDVVFDTRFILREIGERGLWRQNVSGWVGWVGQGWWVKRGE